MDLQRSASKPLLWRRRGPRVALALALLGGLVLAGVRARPAQLTVAGTGVVTAAVERGPLDIDLRASGVLLPSDMRWITAQVEGRVERIEVQAGARVQRGDLLLRLVNPQLQQRADEARWTFEQSGAELRALQAGLDSQLLNQQAAVQRAELALRSAELQWAADQDLLKDGMVSKLAWQRSGFNVEQARQNLTLERGQLQRLAGNMAAQLAAKQAAQARLAKTLQRELDQVAALDLRASMDGIVQEIAPQPGQNVAPGTSLAKLARADALYAEIQVQEAMARDLAPGQAARIDLRSGGATIAGTVARIAPKVSNGVVKVDIRLEGALPREARPDLSVDGTIALHRLADTLQLQRPIFSQADAAASVFRVGADGMAERVHVQFGAAAVTRIAIRSGLREGDRVVVSDTSAWREAERVRIN